MHPNADYVAKYLAGLDFPATREQVVAHAEGEGADSAVTEALRGLPDRQLESAEDALGQLGASGSPFPDSPEEATRDSETGVEGASPSPGRALGGGTARGAGPSPGSS